MLLDFWATWCGPCEESIPHLQERHRRHGGEGLTVVGVSVVDDEEAVEPYVKDHGMRYAVAVDAEKDVMDAFDVRSIPTTVLIDRAGKVRGRWLGSGGAIDREMDAKVREVLAER